MLPVSCREPPRAPPQPLLPAAHYGWAVTAPFPHCRRCRTKLSSTICSYLETNVELVKEKINLKCKGIINQSSLSCALYTISKLVKASALARR
jgi:hypothetical protein